MIEMKSDSVKEYIKLNRDIILIFGSATCKHCLELKPHLEELQSKFPTKLIIFADGDKNPKSADLYNIEAYPTILHFINSELSKKFISNNINKIKKLWK